MSYPTEHEEMYVVQASENGIIRSEGAYNNERTAIKHATRVIREADIIGEVDNVRILWEGELVAEWVLEHSESGSSFIQVA